MDDGEFLSRHFTQFTPSRSRLWSACSKRQHAQEVTTGQRDEISSSWSSDGKTLVYGNWADEKGQTDGIHLLDLQTHEITALAGSAKNMWFPLWSPDGRHIVVLSVNEQKMLLFDVKSQKWTKRFVLSHGCRIDCLTFSEHPS